MRTTLTLDEDVTAKLKREVRRSGKPFKQVVNEFLRLGFASRSDAQPPKAFKVRARALGTYPGRNYDNIGELLEQVEGPLHR